MCKLREYLLRALDPKLAEILRKLDAVLFYVHQNNKKLEKIMATLPEAIQGWREYATLLKAQRDEAVGIAQDANDRAQAAATALADFQANDAETDATQLAEQAAADAKAVQDALDDFKKQDEPATPDSSIDDPEIPDEPVVEPAPTTGDPADTHAAPPAE